MSLISYSLDPPSIEQQEYYIYHAVDYYFESDWWSGKWFAFVDRDEVDELWQKVLAELKYKTLGPAAKVSTAKDNPLQQYSQLENGRTHMIIVYSRDYENAEDRLRIAKVLRDRCGLQGRALYYKRDQETLAGTYGEDCWYSVLPHDKEEEILNERLPAR